MRTISILYFASVREAVGHDCETIELPEGVTTPRALLTMLAASSAGYASAFADLTRLRVAVDQQLSDLDAALGAASEIAFFPPVTGG